MTYLRLLLTPGSCGRVTAPVPAQAATAAGPAGGVNATPTEARQSGADSLRLPATRTLKTATAWIAQGRIRSQRRADGSRSEFTRGPEVWWSRPKTGDSREARFTEIFQRAGRMHGRTECKGSSRGGTTIRRDRVEPIHAQTARGTS